MQPNRADSLLLVVRFGSAKDSSLRNGYLFQSGWTNDLVHAIFTDFFLPKMTEEFVLGLVIPD
jgi:hypothetical protein